MHVAYLQTTTEQTTTEQTPTREESTLGFFKHTETRRHDEQRRRCEEGISVCLKMGLFAFWFITKVVQQKSNCEPRMAAKAE